MRCFRDRWVCGLWGEAYTVTTLTDRIRRSVARPPLIGADLERGVGQQICGLSELPPPAALSVHPDAEGHSALSGFKPTTPWV